MSISCQSAYWEDKSGSNIIVQMNIVGARYYVLASSIKITPL